MRGVALVAMLLVSMLPALPAWAVGERIIAVDISGNTKTNDETVRDIAGVEKGDKLVDGLVERMTLDLQSCGLFKEVSVRVDRVSARRVRVKIVARDKHSWIIAPTFYTSPGNVGGGLGFGENNLFGRNEKLLIYGQIATADSFFLGGYLDPSIAGSRFYWRIDTLLRHSSVTEYDSPGGFLGEPAALRITTVDSLGGGLMLGMYLWRGFSLDTRLRAATVDFRDPHYADGVDPQGLPQPARPPEEDGWDVATQWRFTRDSRANWNGVTNGTVMQLSLEHSLPVFGSHYNYWLGGLKAQLYKRFFTTHNLVMKTGLGLGWHLPFQQELAAGGVSLRGYRDKQFRGDFKSAATVEYSFQVLAIKALAFRLLGFWDSAFVSFLMNDGNTMRDYLPGQTEDKLNRFRNGVGGGLRMNVKSIVLPLLGVDFGYGIEARDYHIYLAVGLTEL